MKIKRWPDNWRIPFQMSLMQVYDGLEGAFYEFKQKKLNDFQNIRSK